jgi:serine protease inhibitor
MSRSVCNCPAWVRPASVWCLACVLMPLQAAWSQDVRGLVSANTRFGLNLFAELTGNEPSENAFISPSSVAFALSMAYNGAAGQTRDAMAKALELQGTSVEEVNRANAALMASLMEAEPGVELSIANSLWAKAGFEFKDEFMAANREFYSAEVTALDLLAPGASKTINDWVSENTKGKIPEIVPDRLDPLTILLIINAIYFKGLWDEPFDEALTKEQPFTLLDGSKKPVQLMSQGGDYPYFEGDGLQAISLPYKDKRVSMIVILPDEDSSLAELCRDLDAETWEAWVSRLSKRTGTIALPRFRVEYEAGLNDALTALGMGIAFTDRADFGNLCDDPARISEVKHKTFVEVNEEGTEAAAATVVGIVTTAAPIQRPFRMVVDRPFLCAIRDNETGTVLFMGAIVDPPTP